MQYTPETLPAHHRREMDELCFDVDQYDDIHVLEQSAGYPNLYVAHSAKDGVTILCQKQAHFMVIFTAEAPMIGRFAQALHEKDERGFYSRNLSSAGKPWELTWMGRKEGNRGDWTLALKGTEYKDRIKGCFGLDELATALRYSE